MSKLRIIKVRCRIPDGVSDEEVASFVAEWLECGGGCRHIDDPLFHSLSVERVTVGMRGTKYVNTEPNKLPEDE